MGTSLPQWGDINRIDPVYSVAKSFLSTLAGIAVDRGMIKNVHDPMKSYATGRWLRLSA
jgi:CubicO group peptidase (beta-lactamase class C family)